MPCLLNMQFGQLPAAEIYVKSADKKIEEQHNRMDSFATNESLNANLTVNICPFV